MTERRFTDDEVARILKRASDMDRRDGSPRGTGMLARGLSLGELQEVAEEVGLPRELIARAAGELEGPRRSGVGHALLGGSPVSQRTQVVERALTPAELAQVVRVVDEVVPAQGTLTEALGSVRWNGQGRFLSRQIVLQPTGDETRIQVQERYSGRTRAITHLMPVMYGLGIGLVVGAELLGGAGAGLAATMAGGVGGWGIGRAIWAGLKGASARRVRGLSDAISRAVSDLSATPR